MIIEDLIISIFMEAWFKENYDRLSKQDFEQAYAEYMDVSGLYKSKSFQELSYINYLSIRVASLTTAVNVERDFVNTFGAPYEPGFSFFKRYNYNLFWNGDKEQFLNYLLKIETKELKYKKELVNREKTFVTESAKKVVQQKSLMQTRHEFIRNISTLGKNGYKIERNSTTVEELALIIKESLEEVKDTKK